MIYCSCYMYINACVCMYMYRYMKMCVCVYCKYAPTCLEWDGPHEKSFFRAPPAAFDRPCRTGWFSPAIGCIMFVEVVYHHMLPFTVKSSVVEAHKIPIGMYLMVGLTINIVMVSTWWGSTRPWNPHQHITKRLVLGGAVGDINSYSQSGWVHLNKFKLLYRPH